jgi:REP element-mobilizing transposase RayT
MPIRRTSRLHRARQSIPGARYFVTLCTQGRAAGLSAPTVTGSVHAACVDSDAAGDTVTLACTVMSDHFHWLLVLGPRLDLGRIVARFKAMTREALLERGLGWQRDFYEHRLRPEEAAEAYALYVFLNPYSAALVSPAEGWPGWRCGPGTAFGFLEALGPGGTPPAAWLDIPPARNLSVGE